MSSAGSAQNIYSLSLHIAILLGSLNVAVDVSGLTCSRALDLDGMAMMVGRWGGGTLEGILILLGIIVCHCGSRTGREVIPEKQ